MALLILKFFACKKLFRRIKFFVGFVNLAQPRDKRYSDFKDVRYISLVSNRRREAYGSADWCNPYVSCMKRTMKFVT